MTKARTLPIFLKLAGRRCVVVGGGAVAAQKAEALLEAGAQVTVIAPRLGAALSALSARSPTPFAWVAAPFREGLLDGAYLVVAATNDILVNRRVHAAGERRGALVNVVDVPELCHYYAAAVVDRFPLRIAVGTDGAAPLVSRIVRERLERVLPEGLTALTAHFAARRPPRPRPKGEVWLVGAGPGDPDLLTLKAFRLLQEADVIVHDRLATEEVLALAPRRTPRLSVGKTPGGATTPQEVINRMLIAQARAGKRVLRLKGGDPFVFGRGGEELQALAARGIPVTVVPGVTAGLAAAAVAGIPLSHRGVAPAVTVISGHRAAGAPHEYDWKSLAAPSQTLLVYMAVETIGMIAERLMRHDMPANTPAALVQGAATAAQRVVVTTLDDLASAVRRHRVTAPAIVIIGAVVGLRTTVLEASTAARDATAFPLEATR